MTVEVGGHELSTALIFDDQEDAREAYADTLQDVGLSSILETGPIGGLNDCLQRARGPGQVALCDHFLHHRNYAQFEGAQFVKVLYEQHVPAVLCTQYDELVDNIRPYRRWIPALERPSEMDGGRFLMGIEECFLEFANTFKPHRKPWRTQIKIAEIRGDEKQFFVEIPAWGPTPVPLRFEGVPDDVLENLKEDWRCRAYVNLGAESLTELYISDWEMVD
jgi:hypothetical protein